MAFKLQIAILANRNQVNVNVILDVDVSAKYDGTVDNREEGGVADVESDEIFTVNFNSISRLHTEHVTIPNIVQVL